MPVLAFACASGGDRAAPDAPRSFGPITDRVSVHVVHLDRPSHPSAGPSMEPTARAATPDRLSAYPQTTTGQTTAYHVPVLMYHRVAPASDRGVDMPGLVVDPRRFDAQLSALQANGWRTITSEQLAAAVMAGAPVPPRTFVITIDDGRDDGYTNAFPILEKHGFVATYFVITARIGRRHYLTWSELRDMQAAGMEIGNHTSGHVDEKRFSRTQTDHQVEAAETAIRTHLGIAPRSFAYPFGQAPANLVASVMSSGLWAAYTTVGGAFESSATSLFWPRIRIDASTTSSGVLWLVQARA
jgi:peptidoglycan/xylan/chitin deacetylase (PgdA/CDA1 family)